MFDYFRGMARYTAGGELAHGQDDAQVVVVVPFLAYLLWQHSPHSFSAGDDAGGFDTSDGVDGAVCGVM